MTQARNGVLLSALLAAGIVTLSWSGTAVAEFTCSSNADCFASAQQCDPGGIPCNDGICDPDDPDADAIGCVLIPNDGNCNDGRICNGQEFCDPNHGCQPGSPPSCNDQIACTIDSCDDATNSCKHERKNSLCSNGLFCDGTERCDEEEGCLPGKPPNCNDNSSCTVDSCDEAANECKHVGNDQQCSDGVFCNGAEICGPNGCEAGTPPSCGDGVGCTTDVCNPQQDRCVNTPSDAFCNDNNICDGIEVCSPTQGCREGTPLNCNDGQFCNGVEICAPASGCAAGTPPNCADNIPCTTDACNEATDSCTHAPNNTLCSDGNFCDGVEICSPTQGCQAGSPPNCNDGVACTVDACDESNDRCNNQPNNTLCSDNQFCDGVEVCHPTRGCEAGPPQNCSDGVDCTIDRCVEATDTCTHSPNDAFCNNGDFCDGVEFCSPQLDCVDGTPPDCSDGTDCTIDDCIESTNSCRHLENPSFCNDGLHCNGVERCDPLLDCYFGLPPDCADENACTVDVCVEETDSCSHTPSNELCTNGLFCDGVEVCSPQLGCTPGTPPVCDDEIACTEDDCSNETQSCVFNPDDTFCNNGLFCDGVEQCLPGTGCVPGGPINCGDELVCTTDFCFEPEDECRNTPNGELCGNGVFNPECGEECDEDNGEICNNDVDDDGDMLVDCADPDCNELPQQTCDENCMLVPPCVPLLRDPAIISFGTAASTTEDGQQRAPAGQGQYSFHARIMPTTPIDPIAEGFLLTLSNANGEIYRAELDASDFKWTRSSYVYRAEDTEKAKAEGGIVRIGLRKRFYNGELGYGIRYKAYGDFSRATLPHMTTQVYFGNDVGFVSATWTGEPGRWSLRPRDYNQSTGGVP